MSDNECASCHNGCSDRYARQAERRGSLKDHIRFCDVGATVGTGSEHKAGVLEGNMNTIIMMRVKGKDTAELLVNQLSKTTIDRLTRVTSANDSADIDNKVHFTSKNEDRITTEAADLITVDHVMQLPKGQAFMLTKGSELYKVRFPLINDKADNIQIPEHVDEMCEEMKQRYQTSDEWWNFAHPMTASRLILTLVILTLASSVT